MRGGHSSVDLSDALPPFLILIAFFVVLFTGEYPENWHRFNTGTMRWQNRVSLYLAWLYRDYPPFAGRPDTKETFDFEGPKLQQTNVTAR